MCCCTQLLHEYCWSELTLLMESCPHMHLLSCLHMWRAACACTVYAHVYPGALTCVRWGQRLSSCVSHCVSPYFICVCVCVRAHVCLFIYLFGGHLHQCVGVGIRRQLLRVGPSTMWVSGQTQVIRLGNRFHLSEPSLWPIPPHFWDKFPWNFGFHSRPASP